MRNESPKSDEPHALEFFDASIHGIYSATDPATFPEKVLPVLLKITRSQCAGMCVNALLPGDPYVAFAFEGMKDRIKWQQMSRANYDDHPTAKYIAKPAPKRALRITDYFENREELISTRHYREHLRPLGVEFELTLLLDTALSQRIGISVARAGSDYTDDEVNIASRLGPHLKRAFHHAQTLAQLRESATPAGLADSWSEIELTPRESEVLRWIATGRTNRDIANLLGVKPATVKSHLENVFHKLGVQNRAAAVAALRALPPPKFIGVSGA